MLPHCGLACPKGSKPVRYNTHTYTHIHSYTHMKPLCGDSRINVVTGSVAYIFLSLLLIIIVLL